MREGEVPKAQVPKLLKLCLRRMDPSPGLRARNHPGAYRMGGEAAAAGSTDSLTRPDTSPARPGITFLDLATLSRDQFPSLSESWLLACSPVIE